MTSEEIDVLPAGRELDTLILKSVLGWKRAGAAVDQSEYWIDAEGQYAYPGGVIPSFSTDIAAAWLVLTRFSSYDLDYEGEVSGETACTVGYWPGSKYVYAKAVVAGRDAPLTICRAALKAVSS